MRKTLCYDDVLLVPQYSDIRSRSEIDISTDLGKGLVLQTPIIASPMDTISGEKMAIAMSECGGTAIVHRYNSIEEQMRIVTGARENGNDKLIIGAAVGISGDFLNRAAILQIAGADFICVDVAHGHHIAMKEALRTLRSALGDDMHIMAGNIATFKGINDLADWGADSIRCNIGGGSICSTRVQTGHGMPGLQTVLECAMTNRNVTIIADGGIKTSGDIVKALAAGADAIMVGSLLGGTDEAPGDIMTDNENNRWKIYRGMASKEAQIDWRGKYSSFEGISATIPYRGSAKEIMNDLERGVRSGFSYSGARNLCELQAKSEFIQQTSAGFSESKTHITNRN